MRENAEDYCIDPGKVVALVFSAGGHLVASAAGMADNLPFYNTLTSDDHGDQGVTRKNATIEFDFDDYGVEHIGTGAVWDAHEAEGRVTSVVVKDTPEYIVNRL